jgi:hypothetical protein
VADDTRKIVEGLAEQRRMGTRQQLREACKHPFVCLPGRPAGHIVVGEMSNGEKIRVEAIEQVFNDMLLVDSLKGAGYFKRYAKRNEELLAMAERLYRHTALQALARWITEPPSDHPIEWPFLVMN